MMKEKFEGLLPCCSENFQNKKFLTFRFQMFFAHSGTEPQIFFVFLFIFSHIKTEVQLLPNYYKKIAK